MTVSETTTVIQPVPDVSIVVCTHNRAVMLADALASLRDLRTHGKFSYEIVVIDNASKDDTPAVVERAARATAAPVRYHFEGKKGIASARNRGLQEAAGQWIAFFDDDQLADPNWLGELLKMAHAKNVKCVGGAVLLQYATQDKPNPTAFVRMLLGEALWSLQPAPYSLKHTPGTGNLMIHRSVLDLVGKFDEAFQVRSEDTDLFRRIHKAGFAAWYNPSAIVHHITPEKRLEMPYLEKLSSQMGESVAKQEYADHGAAKFALHWFAKWLRMRCVYMPSAWFERTQSNFEKLCGLKCQIALAHAYHQQGWQLLKAKSPSFSLIPAAAR
jgi:GT2 family glycosyltransferase